VKIVLGKSEGKNVSLDVERLLSTRLLIQANSGKGKSWLIRLIAEQLFGKVPVIIIDPEGEFATLREKFGYVLVGKGGETPADPRSAALVAHKFLELRASAVCDLYEMKPFARHEWVRNFCEALIDAPKNLWHSCVVIVDEAHTFCPEKGAGESVAAESVIGLATRGRKRGYALVLATQRLGKLRKDSAAELLNVMIGGTFIDIDRKRAADALGVYGKDQHKFFDEIKLLKRGSFFALGPAISDERVLVEVGDVETTHPEAGSTKHAAGPPPAPDAIARLLPKLSDLPKQAEEKAKTEAEFRAEIRSLKAQLRSQPTKAVAPSLQQERERRQYLAEVHGAYRKELSLRDKALREMGTTLQQISQSAHKSAGLAALIGTMPKIEIPGGEIQKRGVLKNASVIAPAGTDHPRPDVAFTENNGSLSRPQHAILRALAEFDAIGRSNVPKTWVAALAGASHKSSAYTNNLGALRTLGVIEYDGTGGMRLTAQGKDRAPQVEPPDSSEEMLDRCLKIASRPQGEILKVVHATYPESIGKEELAEKSGASPKSSAYTNNLGALRSAGMIEYVSGGVKAAGWLFI
jgi:hypothetical protein